MRSFVASLLEVLGLVALSVGSFVTFGLGVGLIVTGVVAVAVGMATA